MNVPFRQAVGAVCLYEAAGCLTRRCPTVSALCKRFPLLTPIVLVGLGVHLTKKEHDAELERRTAADLGQWRFSGRPPERHRQPAGEHPGDRYRYRRGAPRRSRGVGAPHHTVDRRRFTGSGGGPSGAKEVRSLI